MLSNIIWEYSNRVDGRNLLSSLFLFLANLSIHEKLKPIIRDDDILTDDNLLLIFYVVIINCDIFVHNIQVQFNNGWVCWSKTTNC